MIDVIKNIFAVMLVGAIALFIYAKGENEKQEKQRAADYAAERAWKDPLIRNCENAVRKMADAGTLKFGGMMGLDTENIDKTDNGYLYYLQASDATTGNKPISMLCYTDRNGQVIRVVPRNQY